MTEPTNESQAIVKIIWQGTEYEFKSQEEVEAWLTATFTMAQ